MRLSSLAVLSLVLPACGAPPPVLRPATEIPSPAGEGSGQAHLAVGPGGTVVLSWLEPGPEAYALKFSSLLAGGWSPSRTIAEGSSWFVNWADFPSVVPLGEDLWAAHWLAHGPDNYYGYDVAVTLSRDAGGSWDEPATLHLDGTPTEHGFVTLFPWAGDVGAVWLDGRNMMVDGEAAFVSPAGDPLGMSLHYARFDAAGERIGSEALDELVCDCCRTDVAVTSESAVLAYRDRTTEEIRDVVVRRLAEDGWQAPVPLAADNWFIAACPINGPAIAATGTEVAVAWFSAPDNQPRVRFARSRDGGRTFGEPLDIDAAGSFGHVDVALTEGGDAIVSWYRGAAEGLALSIRVVSRAGELGEVQTVAELDTARPLDFPQMVYEGGRLIFAWHDIGEVDTVKTATVLLD